MHGGIAHPTAFHDSKPSAVAAGEDEAGAVGGGEGQHLLGLEEGDRVRARGHADVKLTQEHLLVLG